MKPPEPTAFGYPNTRPKDAATLIVLRRDPDALRVLMGRRADRHAFMPGAVVFPGGRVEPEDEQAPALDGLHPVVEAKLLLGTRRSGVASPRALALAAIRETFEETGVLIGRAAAQPAEASVGSGWMAYLGHGVIPVLQPLRLVARAITPPRSVRRFDTRFFAVFEDCIAHEAPAPDDELTSPAWLTFAAAREQPLPLITRTILDDLAVRLTHDPELAADGPAPFHAAPRGKRRSSSL